MSIAVVVSAFEPLVEYGYDDSGDVADETSAVLKKRGDA
jgi:hypothetical protein